MKCTHGKGSASAVLQQSHQRGMEKVELQFSHRFLVHAFLGVWKGLPSHSRPSIEGWVQFVASAGIWWDLEQLSALIFQFINEISRHPFTLFCVCSV